MSEAQFDEIFKKLEEVLFDIIKNNNCQTITSSEFYDKFNSKFSSLKSPFLKSTISFNKNKIISIFDKHRDDITSFCSLYTESKTDESIQIGITTIINYIVNEVDNSKIETAWARYKLKSNGGKKRKSFKIIKNKTNNLQNKKTKKHKWSQKYKNSINCRRPKGFSQKQYCKYGRKK